LAHEPAATCAESEANSNLLLAGGEPRQQQSGHVRAGQQEDEADDDEDQTHEATEAASNHGMQAGLGIGEQLQRLAFIAVWELLGEPGHDRVGGGESLIRCGARLQSTDHWADPVIATLMQQVAALKQLLLHHHRYPERAGEAAVGAQESLLGDPDHGEMASIEHDLPAHDVSSSAEPALPQPVAQHGHRVRPFSTIFLRREATAEAQSDAQQREVVAGDDGAPDSLVALARAEVEGSYRLGDQPLEDIVPVDQVNVVGVREGCVLEPAGPVDVEPDESFRLPDPRSPVQQCVGNAEGRGVRTDAERDAYDCGKGESGIGPELADGVSDVLQQVVHSPSPCAFSIMPWNGRPQQSPQRPPVTRSTYPRWLLVAVIDGGG